MEYTVADIRAILIKLGLTIEEANAIKGKSNLIKKWETMLQENDSEYIEVAQTQKDRGSELLPTKVSENSWDNEADTPSRTSPEWNDYVLSLFTKDELINKNPTVDGLRRVVELIIGEIIESHTHVVETPKMENGDRATVTHTIIIDDDEHKKVFTEAADCFPGNTEKEFAKYTVATASTRAEGRALRKILKLRKVVAAEEITEEPVEDTDNKSITQTQINSIDLLCRRNNIDVMKFVNTGENQYPKIQDVFYETAKRMLRKLNEYQQTNTIPTEILNYKTDWR